MSAPLTSFERAARLFKQAEKLGCDTPTESMIADAIQDAEFDTLHNPEIIAERHGDPRIVKRFHAAIAEIKRTTPYNGGYVRIGEICDQAEEVPESSPTFDRRLLLRELQAAQDHLAKCAGAIVRADHSLAHLMYNTGMQIKTLIERL